MANTLKLEIVTAEGPAYSDDVEMVTLPGVAGQFGVYPQHVPLMTQMVPGEIIVRKDGRDTFFAAAGDSSKSRPPASRSSPIWRFKPTKLTKPKPKKPGNAPKLGSRKNSRTKKSPPSTPRWLAPWSSCASSAASANEASRLRAPEQCLQVWNRTLRHSPTT